MCSIQTEKDLLYTSGMDVCGTQTTPAFLGHIWSDAFGFLENAHIDRGVSWLSARCQLPPSHRQNKGIDTVDPDIYSSSGQSTPLKNAFSQQ